MKKLLLVVVLAAAGYVVFGSRDLADTAGHSSPQAAAVSTDRIGSEADHTQVQGAGVVTRVLSDDDNGSRHQRFILRLASGQTLLVAHNIDLAPRIANLRDGDTVEFSGEYVWNAKGGIVHWTHRDPAGQHVAGWLKHGGRVYQ